MHDQNILEDSNISKYVHELYNNAVKYCENGSDDFFACDLNGYY